MFSCGPFSGHYTTWNNILLQSDAAFSLVVCIAPSMLGPPTSLSSERENRFIKKSTLLIQFLIESCCGMFGGEFTSPFGESSVRHATADRACDTSGPEMTAGPHSPESSPARTVRPRAVTCGRTLVRGAEARAVSSPFVMMTSTNLR